MKERLCSISSKVARFGIAFVVCVVFLIAAVLFLLSITETASVGLNEHITFYSDNILYNLLWLVVIFACGTAFIMTAKKAKVTYLFSSSQLAIIVGILSLILGIIWVTQSKVLPTHDSKIVTEAGMCAVQGDYSPFRTRYFNRFPFQLGYVLWNEIFVKIFSINEFDELIVIQYVNVCALALSVAGIVKITDRIFKNKCVTFVTALMLVLFIQPIIFSVFLYGTLPGFVFAVWSVFFFIKYIENKKIYNAVISSVLIAISVCLKLNNMIFAVAMIILFLVDFLKDKRIRSIVCAVLMCFLAVFTKELPIIYYEALADVEFDDGIPMTCWLSMGLGESVFAPGWYDSTDTVVLYDKMNGDVDKINEITKDNIKERLTVFADDPEYTYNFFKDKISSQWNETTFQSIWNNNVREQFGEKSGIAKYVCDEGEEDVKKIMDINVQFIYFGFLCACFYFVYSVIKRGNVDISTVTFLVVITGGFLYHLLFEAKSQYVLTYVIIMIPYAVYGMYILSTRLKKLYLDKK